MPPSPPYAPHVELKIREVEELLDEVKHRRCMWDWARTVAILDRIERLVGELRAELEPPEPDDTVARIKLYRSNTGSGWTAAWFVDVDEPRQAGGLVGHHETWRSAYGAALCRLEDHLDVT